MRLLQTCCQYRCPPTETTIFYFLRLFVQVNLSPFGSLFKAVSNELSGVFGRSYNTSLCLVHKQLYCSFSILLSHSYAAELMEKLTSWQFWQQKRGKSPIKTVTKNKRLVHFLAVIFSLSSY